MVPVMYIILLNSFVSQNFFTALLRYISHTVKFTHSKSKFSGFYYDRHILTSIDGILCSQPHLYLPLLSFSLGAACNPGLPTAPWKNLLVAG